MGLVVDKPVPPAWTGLAEDQWLYFLALATTVLSFVLVAGMLRSRVGRALHAMRDNEIAAEVLGVNLAHYKTLSTVVANARKYSHWSSASPVHAGGAGLSTRQPHGPAGHLLEPLEQRHQEDRDGQGDQGQVEPAQPHCRARRARARAGTPRRRRSAASPGTASHRSSMIAAP